MAMMMDPYGMQKEKRSKKTKERKEAHCRTGNADLAACVSHHTQALVMPLGMSLQEAKEPKSKKEKGAKHKEPLMVL